MGGGIGTDVLQVPGYRDYVIEQILLGAIFVRGPFASVGFLGIATGIPVFIQNVSSNADFHTGTGESQYGSAFSLLADLLQITPTCT